RLTNTILLSGPNSTGKTAAVYACAAELGWEIFEVYPGVGKRSGANLDNLVGEVGKNHLVRKTQLQNENSGTNPKLNGTQHEEHEAAARQSLILLEEVDVLFKEDVNFWGSIISLIKDCKRPVILTCNDASLVPVAELPLQDVLNFQLCSTSVATSFLQALCCAEGYLLDREVLSRFYESPNSSGLDYPRLDLRRAIHNLQLW
ncbi:P-loop containing nucleoside triphosphate hydrolase protein, partial [Lentinula edodes]|uniref:P-loop containing nucleoside triphosphate hydrolase protein n=1 Tax=Lentinula edodes TaxID=5353 RepID=UPI001E8E811E